MTVPQPLKTQIQGSRVSQNYFSYDWIIFQYHDVRAEELHHSDVTWPGRGLLQTWAINCCQSSTLHWTRFELTFCKNIAKLLPFQKKIRSQALVYLVKHEIRDLLILEIFEFKTIKFSTQKLKSSKVLPDLIIEYLDQITLK